MWRRRFYAYQTHLRCAGLIPRLSFCTRVWAFIAPALYNMSVVWSYAAGISSLLFIGMAFAICRIARRFGSDAYGAGRGTEFRQISPAILALSWRFYVAFGVAF